MNHQGVNPNQAQEGGGRSLDRLLLTPREAAHVLGIGRTKLFELLASGALDSVQIGNCRRVPRDAVEDFLARLRTERSIVGVGVRRGA